jgi:uncharacterized membrane protein
VSRSLVVNLAGAGLAVVAAATVVGMIVLWPPERTIERPESLVAPQTQQAEVVGLRATRCIAGQTNCVRVSVRLESGPDEGRTTAFTFSGRDVNFELGDRIRVFENRIPDDAVLGDVRIDPYGFSDFERRRPLLWLVLIFVALVLATARWKGVRALAGLVASLGIVVLFIVPAILAGHSPSGVALVGALAIMFVTIPLAHGLGVKTLAACLGTASALLLTLGLASAFTGLAHLSGLSSDEAVFIQATVGAVSVQGLLLAGMVIAALGVLDDLTVTQASTVLALRHANPRLEFTGLFKGAIGVGQDHITATVNTLVLAYVGASLPVLLVFSLADTPLGDALNFEVVAAEIVGTLVGSIGLIAAVPITTALATLLALRLRPNELKAAAAHGHAH